MAPLFSSSPSPLSTAPDPVPNPIKSPRGDHATARQGAFETKREKEERRERRERRERKEEKGKTRKKRKKRKKGKKKTKAPKRQKMSRKHLNRSIALRSTTTPPPPPPTKQPKQSTFHVGDGHHFMQGRVPHPDRRVVAGRSHNVRVSGVGGQTMEFSVPVASA